MKYFKLFWEQLKYSWTQKLSLQLTTLLVLTGSFLAVSLTTLFLVNFNSAVNSFGEKFEVSVYLTDQNIDKNKSKIKSIINKSKLFSEVNFVHKDEALKTFKEKMKDHVPSFLVEEKSANPLPSSFTLKLKKDLNNKAGFTKVGQFASSILSEEGVDDVAYGQVWAEKYATFLKTYKVLSVGIVIFLFISIILIIGNSIKSSISQRRREIEVLELVGATRAYIRMPFILEGAFMGLLGAGLSIAISYSVFSWILKITEENMGVLFNGINIHFLSVFMCIFICVMGLLIGALGAGVCIRRMNSGWAAVNGS